MWLMALAVAGPIEVPEYDPARTFAPLVEAVSPAVVAVKTESDDPIEGKRQSEGSGFIISERGRVLTNAHVLKNASRVTVRLNDGREVPATVLGSDRNVDIAVLELKGKEKWPWLELGDSDAVRTGDRVLAVGNPLGLGTSVTSGIVSAKGRVLNLDRWYRSDDFIQTDAAINQGNSGGPLFDLSGGVIGMNTAVVFDANTIGFSIPANLLAEVVDDLANEGHIRRGFLGVRATQLSADEKKDLDIETGAVVRHVFPDTPATRAGIEKGDVIVLFNGNPVTNGRDLIASIGNLAPGTSVAIELIRDTRRFRRRVKLGAQADREQPLRGVELRVVSADTAVELGIETGVEVGTVPATSPAAQRLAAGDVIVAVDGKPVSSPTEVRRIIGHRSKTPIRFDLYREGNERQVIVERR